MSVDDVTPDREALGDDLGTWSIDDETQLQPEDTLVDRGVDDVLDEGYSPPDSPRGSLAHGTTAAEQREPETIEERLSQEEPDPDASFDDDDIAEPPLYGGPGPDTGDPYAPETGDRRSGRLVAPDEGAHPDHDGQAFAQDVGIDGGGASAEEAAMHIVEDS